VEQLLLTGVSRGTHWSLYFSKVTWTRKEGEWDSFKKCLREDCTPSFVKMHIKSLTDFQNISCKQAEVSKVTFTEYLTALRSIEWVFTWKHRELSDWLSGMVTFGLSTRHKVPRQSDEFNEDLYFTDVCIISCRRTTGVCRVLMWKYVGPMNLGRRHWG